MVRILQHFVFCVLFLQIEASDVRPVYRKTDDDHKEEERQRSRDEV